METVVILKLGFGLWDSRANLLAFLYAFLYSWLTDDDKKLCI